MALVIVAIVFYVAIYPWLMIGVGVHLLPNPPKPKITYGEFPFRLVYEIDGERKIVEDTLICEFDGFELEGENGKYRKWKSRLASGNERITLLKVDETMEIYYSPGRAEYYMNDLRFNLDGNEFSFPNANYSKKIDKTHTVDSIILADELWSQYKIKLISWDYTQPIKNNFP